jgi:hypothetical protein
MRIQVPQGLVDVLGRVRDPQFFQRNRGAIVLVFIKVLVLRLFKHVQAVSSYSPYR